MPETTHTSPNSPTNFSVSGYITAGYNIFSSFALPFIAFIVLLYLSATILGFIPFGGLAHGFFISPLLMVGLLIVADKIQHREPVEFTHFFDAFRGEMGQIILANLLVVLISIIVVIPAMLPLLATVVSGIAAAGLADNFVDNPMAVFATFGLVAWAGVMVVIIAALLVSLLLSFTLHFVYFKKLEAFEAIKASVKLVQTNLSGYFLLMLALAFFNFLGALCLIIGLLVTIPVSYCAWYVAFDDAVGAREKSKDDQDEVMEHFIGE